MKSFLRFCWPAFLLVVAAGFAGCDGRQESPAVANSAPRFSGRITIMPEASLDQARTLFRADENEKVSYWKPTTEQVAKTLDLIREALVSGRDDPEFIGYTRDDQRFAYISEKMAKVLAHYSVYSCQMIGLERATGKTIAFSFFPSEDAAEHPNLGTRFVWVLDGGAAYWRIEFDLATQRFVRFDTNGDA